MGKHRDVAAVHVVGPGAHALGRGSLELGLDGPVMIGHDVPARLAAPGGAVSLLVEQVSVRCDVGSPHQLLLLFGEVTGECLGALRQHPDATVALI